VLDNKFRVAILPSALGPGGAAICPSELGSSNPHAAALRSHLNSRPARTPTKDNLAEPRAIYSENFISRLFVYRARLCTKS
jgi:hypothetical protein